MWSHYADGHRGFVLQFDAKVLKDNFIAPLRKVLYPPKESLPSIVWKNHGQLLAKIHIADKDENSYKIIVDPPIRE